MRDLFNLIRARRSAPKVSNSISQADVFRMHTQGSSPSSVNLTSLRRSVSTARILPAVGAAVKEISERVSDLPLQLYDVSVQGETSDEPIISPLDRDYYVLAESWNADTDAADGLRYLLVDFLEEGLGAALVERGEADQLVAIHNLDPGSLSIQSDGRSTRYQVTIGGERRSVLREELILLGFYRPLNGQYESPLIRNWYSIAAALDATIYFDRRRTARDYFKAAQGVDTTPKDWKQTQETVWESEDAMKGSGRSTVYLPNGIDVQSGSGTGEEDTSPQRTFGVQEVGRIYGIPQVILNDLSRGTYSNYGQSATAFEYTLSGYTKRLARELNRIIFPASTRRITFDTTAIRLLSQKDRYDAYAVGIDKGFLTRNQARLAEGLEPDTEDPAMDEYSTSGTSTPVEDAIRQSMNGSTPVTENRLKEVLRG